MRNVEAFEELSRNKKILVVAGVLAAIFFIFITYFYVPIIEKINAKQESINLLDNEVMLNSLKARHLEKLKKESKELERLLETSKTQLPKEDEISALLKQISDLGHQTGLEFKLWRPGMRRENESGLYAEIPVAVEVEGAYHSMGIFFDKISKLTRIVNISNIKMGHPTDTGKEMRISTAFTATAFAQIEQEQAPEQNTAGTKHGSPGTATPQHKAPPPHGAAH